MKAPGIWVFFFLVVATLLLYTFSSTPSLVFSKNGDGGTSRRLLKGKKSYNESNVDLEDYRHSIDPVPSSKASIKHGPIEHGTPLNPFIPKPPPPDHPNIDGST